MDSLFADGAITVYVTQAAVAGAVGFVLSALGRAHRREGPALWGLAFLALAFHHFAAAMGREMAQDPEFVGVRTFVSGLGLAAGYLFPFLMLAGASRVTGRGWFRSDRRVLLGIAVVGALGGLSVIAFAGEPFPSTGRMMVRVGVRSVLSGLALLAAAAVILPLARGSFARMGLVIALALTGLLNLDFGASTMAGFGFAAVADGVTLRLTELVLLAVTGLSSMAWLVDEERARGDRAEAERAHTAAELDVERERAAFLFRHTVDVIGELKRDGTVVRFSPSVESIVGVPAAAAAGRSIFDWVHPDDRLLAKEQLARVGDPDRRTPVELRMGDERSGVVRWVEVVGTGLADGETLVINARDVTGRRELHERLIRAQKLEITGRLVGSISHDFNNVLMVVTEGAEFALEKLPAEMVEVREELEAIEDASERARRLVRGLLSFTRRTPTTREAIELNRTIRELSESFIGRLVGRDIIVELELSHEPLHVWIDRAELESVVLNLVVNARDAMPGGGRITLRTRSLQVDGADADRVRFTVSDTGEGIEPDRLDSIFEPFFTTKGENGTGLGLATVEGVVRAAGGRVAVESTPGRGTRFDVELPLPPFADRPVESERLGSSSG